MVRLYILGVGDNILANHRNFTCPMGIADSGSLNFVTHALSFITTHDKHYLTQSRDNNYNKMKYAIVFVLSIGFTFLGFVTEVTVGNIRHVQNGRMPNAGAAIFPNIPFVPFFFVGVVWILNQIYPNLGFWAFIGFCIWFVPHWWFSIRKLRQRFNELIANSDVPAGESETHGN